jgi:hypothetical protein
MGLRRYHADYVLIRKSSYSVTCWFSVRVAGGPWQLCEKERTDALLIEILEKT